MHAVLSICISLVCILFSAANENTPHFYNSSAVVSSDPGFDSIPIMAERYFTATGKVQNVMFRQTLIRGAQRRGIAAGASNTRRNRQEVTFTLMGDEAKVQEIVDFLKSGKSMNDWSARVDELVEHDEGKAIGDHTVTTENVDTFRWRSDCEMYL